MHFEGTSLRFDLFFDRLLEPAQSKFLRVGVAPSPAADSDVGARSAAAATQRALPVEARRRRPAARRASALARQAKARSLAVTPGPDTVPTASHPGQPGLRPRPGGQPEWPPPHWHSVLSQAGSQCPGSA